MPKRGRAAHGGGAAKWRHGWIPANAAARAIVRDRQARAKARVTGEEFSSPRQPPFRVRPSKDGNGYEVVDLQSGQVVITSPDRGLAVDLARRRYQWTPTPLDQAQQDLQVKLRSPDVASGTMSLFRGRRDIVQEGPPQFLAQFAKLGQGRSAEDDAINTNPGFYTEFDPWKSSSETHQEVLPNQINCYNCVTAFELRRRGYAAQAAPAPPERIWIRQGMDDGEIAGAWQTPTGQKARFEPVIGTTGLSEATADWPVGARGWVTNVWKDGGGHVYAVEKVSPGPGGTLKAYDPQPGKEVSLTDYLQRSRQGMKVLRTDDLIPTEKVADRVEPSPTVTGTWRPSTRIMGTPAVKLNRKLKADAELLVANGRKELATLPETSMWERSVADTKVAVGTDILESTPQTIQGRIALIKEGIAWAEDEGNLNQDAQDSLRLARYRLKLYENALKRVAPGAGVRLISGVRPVPGMKSPKLLHPGGA